MIINLGHGYRAEWVQGSHYVNYFDETGYCYDCISFAWEKDRATQMDAWQAFIDREYQYA